MSRFKQLWTDLAGDGAERRERPGVAPTEQWVAEARPESQPPRGPVLGALVVGGGVGVLALLVALGMVGSAVGSAKRRLKEPDAERPQVAVAQEAEVGYCTKDFKEV